MVDLGLSHLGGGKTISTFGSICLIANNVVGPAMVSIATSYAQAGWLPTTTLLALCAFLSTVASGFLCETIRAAPGNREFTKRVEITDALKLANVPRPLFLVCFWSFVLLFIANNTAAIVESAQTTDQLLVFYGGRSCALTLYPNPGDVVCVHRVAARWDDDGDDDNVEDDVVFSWEQTSVATSPDALSSPASSFSDPGEGVGGGSTATTTTTAAAGETTSTSGSSGGSGDSGSSSSSSSSSSGRSKPKPSDSPFGDGVWVLSAGFVLTACVVVPLSFLNLDENILMQNLSFIGLGIIVLEWVCQFVGVGGLQEDKPPPLGDYDSSGCMQNLFGNVMFNFAFVLTLPSWLNEKRPEVSEASTISWSVLLATFIFMVLGYTSASSEYATFATTNDDITTVLIASSRSLPLTRFAAFVFPPIVLWSGIPVCAIVVRYNLIAEGILPPKTAAVASAVLPWVLSLCLYAGTLLNSLTSWSGLFLVVPLNFILPCALYLLKHAEGERENAHGSGSHLSSFLKHQHHHPQHADRHPLLLRSEGGSEGMELPSRRGGGGGGAAAGGGGLERFAAFPSIESYGALNSNNDLIDEDRGSGGGGGGGFGCSFHEGEQSVHSEGGGDDARLLASAKALPFWLSGPGAAGCVLIVSAMLNLAAIAFTVFG